MKAALLLLPLTSLQTASAAALATSDSKCLDIKEIYKDKQCCGNSAKASGFQIVPMPDTGLFAGATVVNPCKDKKKTTEPAFNNKECWKNAVLDAVEQSAADVTKDFVGTLVTNATPITAAYYTKGLCPVNVHWHLGAEHRSAGQYDETGTGPADAGRRLAWDPNTRRGFRCKKYKSDDPKFTTPYKWKHCDASMKVGETYEVHWPHSAAGKCGTPWQYQSPFYDGVFCVTSAVTGVVALHTAIAPVIQNYIGVHGQVFVIVNDEKYYYPNLISGMIVDGVYGKEVTKYTGSTTGPSRNNKMCSAYAPITWQVDRTCHLISASSFDKLCADMKAMPADMSSDLYAHGSRELVWKNLTANNHQNRL